MAKEISNTDDIIDSRDVIARIEELRNDLESLIDDVNNRQRDLDEPDLAGDDRPLEEIMEEAQSALAQARVALAGWLGLLPGQELPEDLADLSAPLETGYAGDEAQELAALESLADQCEGCGDWGHGEALIRDSYFQEYAEQLADDIGAIDRNARWPVNCIDWEEAARELQYDYTEVDFDGETYWIRA